MSEILQFFLDAIKQDRMRSFLCASEQDLLFSEKAWTLENAENFILKSADYYLNKS